MIIIALYLILAHLVGDFILQSSKLVAWKNKSMLGLSVHILIHLAANFILLSPLIFSGETWLFYPIIAICFIHFWIDQTKITYDSDTSHKNRKSRAFVLDQVLHAIVISITLLFIRNVEIIVPNTLLWRLYSRPDLIIFFISLIFVTSVLDIYYYEKRIEQTKKAKLTLYSPKTLNRAAIVCAIYALYLIVNLGA